MTADVELLPLPKWAYDNMHLRLRATSLQNRLTVYARAVAEHNVAHATAAKDAEIEALRAEVVRLKRIEFCWGEWLEKTEWVQQTCKPKELGMHRADIMRQRLEQAEARAERLAEALRDLLNVSDKFTGDPEEDAATWVAANDAARAALEQENGDA